MQLGQAFLIESLTSCDRCSVRRTPSVLAFLSSRWEALLPEIRSMLSRCIDGGDLVPRNGLSSLDMAAFLMEALFDEEAQAPMAAG